MTHPSVSAVKALGINPIKLAHPEGKIGLGGLDKEVVVVIHEAIGMAKPAVAGDHVREGVQKRFAIRLVPEDPLPGVTSGGEMIDRPGIL